MSKIYDIAFRMGVLFNILLWTILNIIGLVIAQNDFLQRELEWENSEVKFCCVSRGSWGIPFDWEAKYFVIEGAGAILNIVIMSVCGFGFGFLFKFIWSKISSNRADLK